jgi:hypothetical protein
MRIIIFTINARTSLQKDSNFVICDVSHKSKYSLACVLVLRFCILEMNDDTRIRADRNM